MDLGKAKFNDFTPWNYNLLQAKIVNLNNHLIFDDPVQSNLTKKAPTAFGRGFEIVSFEVIVQHPNYLRQTGPVFSSSFRRTHILLSNWTNLLNKYLSS